MENLSVFICKHHKQDATLQDRLTLPGTGATNSLAHQTIRPRKYPHHGKVGAQLEEHAGLPHENP
jgi:hypothetical protein